MACGVKPALQLQFSAKPDSAFDESLRLAPVQSLKAILDTDHFNFYKSMPIHCFEPFPGSPEGRSPRTAFWFFLQKQKERKNVPFCLLFAEAKSNTKTFLFRLFAKRKVLFSGFSGKETPSQTAPFLTFRKK